MSPATLTVFIMIILVAITIISVYGLNHSMKKYGLEDHQLEIITRSELHRNKPLLMTRIFLYFLVRITYKDICKDHTLTVAELRDILIKDEGVTNDPKILPHQPDN